MELNNRQTAITIAALRYLQQALQQSPLFAAEHLENNPFVSQEEIDTIVEQINLDQ